MEKKDNGELQFSDVLVIKKDTWTPCRPETESQRFQSPYSTKNEGFSDLSASAEHLSEELKHLKKAPQAKRSKTNWNTTLTEQNRDSNQTK